MEIRRRIAGTLEEPGHTVVLMEEEEDRPHEDLVEKFDRLLNDRGVTDVIVFWPWGAKMQTTFDELILLRDRKDNRNLPRIWILHDRRTARIARGVFLPLEPGGRSRYLGAVSSLGVMPLAWSDEDELHRIARELGEELR